MIFEQLCVADVAPEAADYWRRYLAIDGLSEWAGRARRSLKFCEMQQHLIV
jgi:predicted metal-dependent hydrolase